MALHLFTENDESEQRRERGDTEKEHERGHHQPGSFLDPHPKSSTSASLRRRVNRENHPENQEVLRRLQTYYARTHLAIVEKTTAWSARVVESVLQQEDRVGPPVESSR